MFCSCRRNRAPAPETRRRRCDPARRKARSRRSAARILGTKSRVFSTPQASDWRAAHQSRRGTASSRIYSCSSGFSRSALVWIVLHPGRVLHVVMNARQRTHDAQRAAVALDHRSAECAAAAAPPNRRSGTAPIAISGTICGGVREIDIGAGRPSPPDISCIELRAQADAKAAAGLPFDREYRRRISS